MPAGQELTESYIIKLLNKKRSRNASSRSQLILWQVLKLNRLKEPKKITSADSSTDPAGRVSRVLWAPSGLYGCTFLWLCFSTLEMSFLLFIQINYHVQIVLPDLSENRFEGFGHLWWI